MARTAGVSATKREVVVAPAVGVQSLVKMPSEPVH
jgi:hypothetical protein